MAALLPVYQGPISFPARPGQAWQEALPSCTVTLLLHSLTLLGTGAAGGPPGAENGTTFQQKFLSQKSHAAARFEIASAQILPVCLEAAPAAQGVSQQGRAEGQGA